MNQSNFYKKIITIILAITIVGGNFANIFVNTAHAAINKEINYQGKLTNASNVAVADGLYTMEFKLYSVLTGGAALWTETLNSTNKVQVTNGLFSVMLGSTTPFTGVDFNQTLYLGVKIEADSEMSPRKIIGAVPASFVADTLDSISSEQFLRSDAQNATSTSSTFLSILQTGSGKIAEFFGNVSQSVLSILSNGNVGIGSSTPYAALSVVGASGVVADHFTSTSTKTSSVFPYASTTALTVAGRVYASDATVTNTITLASLNGPLQGINGLISATSTISPVYGGTGISTLPSYGNILVGQTNGSYTLTATSSLGLATFAYPFTLGTNFNVGNQATTGIAWFQNGFNASSTSHFDYASTTALSASTICITTDCRTAWPSAGGGVYPFTPTSNFNVNNQATTGIAWFQNGFNASSTSNFVYASTTALSATTLCLIGDSCRTSWPSSGGGAYPFTVATNFNVNNQATTGIAWFQNGFNASSTSHVGSTTFDIGGNVGIGSTSPYSTLSVAGQVVGQNFVGYGTATSSLIGGLSIGSSTMSMANSLLSMTGFKNSYIQTNLQNLSGGNNASAAYVVTADNGNDVSYFTEFGMNNSGYIQAPFSAQNPGDSYVNASDGALVISVASSTNTLAELRFATGGTSSSSIRMTITNSGNVGIGNTSPSSLFTVGTTTGAQAPTLAGTNVNFLGANGAPFRMQLDTFNDSNTFGSQISARRSRGIASAPTAVLADDTLFSLAASGYGTTAYGPSVSSFSVGAASTFTDVSQPTYFRFFTTPTGSITSAERLRITQDGNVGIGSTSPNWMLSVASMGYFGDNVISSYFTATSSTATSTFAGGVNIGSGNLVYDSYTGVTSLGAAEMGNLNFDSDGGVVSWVDMDITTLSSANTAESYSALLDSNPMLTIFGKSDGLGSLIATSTGVGIGTTTPLAMLDIFAGSTTPFTTGFMSNYNAVAVTNQATSSTANVIKTGLNIISSGSWAGTGASNIGLYVSSVRGGTNNYDAVFNGGGTVGIGTTTPNWMLQIASTSVSNTMKGQLALSDLGAGANLKHWLFSSNNGSLFISTSSDLYATSTISALTVNQNGYLGIASTTPGFAFVSGGSSYLGTGTNDSLVLHVGSINYPVAATSTIKNVLNSFTIATSTAFGNSAVFNLSFSSTGASSTVGFFVSTSTGLEAGAGLGISSSSRQMLIVGNGKQRASVSIVNGGLCVDRDGWCTASTSGTITGRALVTSGADVAELYPSNESLQIGEIVSALEHGYVTLAKKEDEDKILGIVSTEPGLILGSGPDEATNPGTRFPIALAGRIPVKISLENGEIKVGDALTLSDTIPGTAMKAKANGKVIGIALDQYLQTSTGGSVLMFVNNYAKVDTAGQIVSTLGQYVSFATTTEFKNNSNFQNSINVVGTVTTDTLVAKNIQSPIFDLLATQIANLSSTTSALDQRVSALENGVAVKLVDLLNSTSSLSFVGNVLFNGGLRVDNISSIGDIINLASDVNIIGRPYFNQDVAGFVLIKKDSKKANVVFNKEYSEQPVVTASMSFNDGDSDTEQETILASNIQSLITKKSTKGFTIILNKPAPYDIRFSWIALAVRNAITSSSTDVNPVFNQVVNTPIPEPSPVISPEPSPVPNTDNSSSTPPTSGGVVVVSAETTPEPSLTPSVSPEITPAQTPEISSLPSPLPEITPTP